LCHEHGDARVARDATQQQIREKVEEMHTRQSPTCLRHGILVIPLSFLSWLMTTIVHGEVVAIQYERDGHYLLTIRDGAVSAVPIRVIAPDGPPKPTPPPNPGPLTERSKAVQAVAAVIDDPQRMKYVQQLAALYRELAAQVDAGKITNQDALEFAVKTGVDMVLADNEKRSAYANLRQKIGALWVTELQDGGQLKGLAKLLQEVSAGLTASVPSSAMAIDLKQIMEIIMIILELLAKLKLQ
jgi:hypothetical protein